MKTQIRFVPIEKWPGELPRMTVSSPFSTAYNKTLALLDTELGQLGAKGVVVQAFFRQEQIRQDGWPYADARPKGSGVILSFQTTARGSLSFPCYRYNKFEDNLRAIALSLQALRAVDRYGVTQRAEQYQGWKQIEAPLPGGFRGKVEAAVFIATQVQAKEPKAIAAIIVENPALRKEYYREAAALLHPDRGGNHELFVRLQQAMAILEGGSV